MSIEPIQVFAWADDGDEFGLNLSRVPCVDEIIEKDDRYYRVFGVHHASLNTEGRTDSGCHAYLSVQALVREPPIPGEKIRRKRSRTVRKKRRR